MVERWKAFLRSCRSCSGRIVRGRRSVGDEVRGRRFRHGGSHTGQEPRCLNSLPQGHEKTPGFDEAMCRTNSAACGHVLFAKLCPLCMTESRRGMCFGLRRCEKDHYSLSDHICPSKYALEVAFCATMNLLAITPLRVVRKYEARAPRFSRYSFTSFKFAWQREACSCLLSQAFLENYNATNR